MAGALLAVALLAGSAAAAPAPAPADAGAQARKILSDPRYQRAFPGGQPAGEGGKGGWRRRPAGDVAPGDRSIGKSLEVPEAVAVLVQWVFVLLAIAALGLVALWGVRSIREGNLRRDANAKAAAGDAPERRRETAAAIFEDADDLAAQGRWADALHALLLQAIRHLAAGSPVTLRASYTSRELLRLVPLSGAAQPAFAGLVRAVELSLFGGAAVGPDEYRANRDRFQVLCGGAR